MDDPKTGRPFYFPDLGFVAVLPRDLNVVGDQWSG
jgi:hypothetical protein